MSRVLKMIPAALIVLTTANLAAQNAQAPAASAARPGWPLSLKVSLVFSRYQGDKKISSIPHTLWVTANEQGRTSLRMGTQVPITSTVFGKEGERAQSSYNYRDVGTNIDCAATVVQDGAAYKLSITITDSSVYYPDQSDAAIKSATVATGAPAFRNFNSSFVLLLHDGHRHHGVLSQRLSSGQPK